MLTNRQQWCGIAGWTARQFDAAVVNGFPARKKTSSRGDNWQVDTRDGIAWIVEQEVAKPRPRARPAAPPERPPGWEAFRAAEDVDDVVQAVSLVNLLALLYTTPRLTALVAAESGLGMDQLFKVSGGLLLTLEAMCGKLFEFWPKDPDEMLFLQDAFEPVNWPWLAKRAGEPDWTPPSYALCWVELDAEERRLSVLKGEEEATRWAEEEKAAARGDA